MTYAFTPAIWPSALTLLFLIALAIYSWRRRSLPGALPFAISCMFAALWAAGSFMAYAAVDVATKIFWTKFQAVWQLPCDTAVTCFILEYAWPGRWLTRRNLTLLFFPSLLLLGLILTNDLHHLIWSSYGFAGSLPKRLGPGGWIFITYAIGLLGIIDLIVFVWLFRRSPQHRWPVIIMVTGETVGRVLYLLERTDILLAVLPLGIFGMAFPFLAFGIALFGFHILDPIPQARRMAIEQLKAGILVLDAQRRIVGLNPAAERIFEAPASRARGRFIKELLPAYPEGAVAEPGVTEIEIDLKSGQEIRHYALAVSLLKDWRGLEVGRLLLLHDLTEQKQAQAQIVAQQRALATLTERERMARELHDSLGQVLGYTGMQVDAAARLSRDGQGDIAAAQLEHLGSVVRQAHADLREHILNLRTAPSLQQPLFAALQRYLVGYNTNYDIRTHLSIDPELREDRFSPEAQLQIFRIVQEALSNARKHGCAHHVDITFTRQDGQVCMTIQDDGLGFAPEKIPAPDQQHFGLQFMQERAAQLGGSLRIQSAPGKGTRVVLEVPADTDAGTRRHGNTEMRDG